MEPAEYDRMDRAEDGMWWYRALRANLVDAWARAERVDGAILDAGCGTGGLLRALGALEPARVRIGLDREPRAARRAADKGRAPTVVGDVAALPFEDASFAAVFSADVLYHREVDARRALAETFRCLRPGGLVLVNVPAFDWLASYHDRRVHGARRFTRSQLQALLSEAGFAPIAVRYWNSLLFPVMVTRRLRPAGADAPSDVEAPPRWLDRTLGAVCRLERALCALGVRWPAGGSLLAVARK